MTTSYCTTDDLAAEVNSFDTGSTGNDLLFESAIEAASRRIDSFCGRRFYLEAALKDREMVVEDGTCLLLEQPGLEPGIEISTATGLIVKADTNLDGTYSTTLTIGTDFRLFPRNAVVDGVPFNEIRPTRTSARRFPCTDDPYLQITATWGWPAVPDAVRKACLIEAAALYKAKDAPFGISTFGDLGGMRVRAALNPIAADVLTGYQIPVLG